MEMASYEKYKPIIGLIYQKYKPIIDLIDQKYKPIIGLIHQKYKPQIKTRSEDPSSTAVAMKVRQNGFIIL
jgi:hypothetical protein